MYIGVINILTDKKMEDFLMKNKVDYFTLAQEIEAFYRDYLLPNNKKGAVSISPKGDTIIVSLNGLAIRQIAIKAERVYRVDRNLFEGKITAKYLTAEIPFVEIYRLENKRFISVQQAYNYALATAERINTLFKNLQGE